MRDMAPAAQVRKPKPRLQRPVRPLPARETAAGAPSSNEARPEDVSTLGAPSQLTIALEAALKAARESAPGAPSQSAALGAVLKAALQSLNTGSINIEGFSEATGGFNGAAGFSEAPGFNEAGGTNEAGGSSGAGGSRHFGGGGHSFDITGFNIEGIDPDAGDFNMIFDPNTAGTARLAASEEEEED